MDISGKKNIKNIKKFSFSGISTFKKCPKAFEYKYVEELPEAFVSIEAHMGSSVHAALEWAYRERMAGKESGPTAVLDQYKQAFWNSDVLESVKVIKEGKTTSNYFDDGKAMIVRFFKRIFERDTADTLLLEEKFEIFLTDEIIFRGIIDRVALGEDRMLRVIDYKTGKTGHPLDNLQLPSYALFVFANNMDNEIRLCIEDLREQRTVEAPFSRREVKSVRSELLGDIGQILETEVFKTSPSILCLWCGYNHVCADAYKNGSGAGPVGVENTGTDCPLCGGRLTERKGKYGPFLGCANFPRCRYTRPVNL
jgi:RecB family exonuclease